MLLPSHDGGSDGEHTMPVAKSKLKLTLPSLPPPPSPPPLKVLVPHPANAIAIQSRLLERIEAPVVAGDVHRAVVADGDVTRPVVAAVLLSAVRDLPELIARLIEAIDVAVVRVEI